MRMSSGVLANADAQYGVSNTIHRTHMRAYGAAEPQTLPQKQYTAPLNMRMPVGLAQRMDGMLSEAGGAYSPFATYACPFLKFSPSVGGGTHRPLPTECPPSPWLGYRCLPTHRSFPLVGCANGASGLSLFHCPMLGPHRGNALTSGHPGYPSW